MNIPAQVHSNELHEMCLSRFNEPVLLGSKLARCIGYGETGVDCYVIVRYPGYPDGKVVWHTCVGGYTWLRLLKNQGQVVSSAGDHWNDYTRLENLLNLNGSPPEAEFLLVLKHDDMENQRTTEEALREAISVGAERNT